MLSAAHQCPRQEGPLNTVTREWAKNAPAVLDGLIEAHFPDAQREASLASPAPWARECDWAKAKKIFTLERLRQSAPLSHARLRAAMGSTQYYCEKGIKCGVVLTVLLDIEGACNHTSVGSIFQGGA